MELDVEKISDYLAQIFHSKIDLSFEDLENLNTPQEKELGYGLICLSEDLQFHKARSEQYISNLKAALFDSSAVVITNQAGIILEANKAFQELTLYTKEELVGQSINLLNSGHHSDSYYTEMWSTISKGSTWNGEFKNLKKDKSPFWVSTYILPIKNDNEIIEYWSISKDISEKVLIQEKLNETNEELIKAIDSKNQLIKEMHHRIKNNLQLLSSMLKMKANASNESEAQSINDIISRINSIASVHEMFYQNVDQRAINLLAYLEATFKNSNTNLDPKTILSITGTDCHITIENCTYIGIIINELITNSIKYAWNEETIIDSNISIHIEPTTSRIKITYKDNGIGCSQPPIKEGLGSSLIQLLIDTQLEGSYQINSNKGYKITLHIPIVQQVTQS